MSVSQPRASVYIDTNRVVSPISPLVFSGFAEHMGRCIYEGIYDPASPHADERGLRKDVLAALRGQAGQLSFFSYTETPASAEPWRLSLRLAYEAIWSDQSTAITTAIVH